MRYERWISVVGPYVRQVGAGLLVETDDFVDLDGRERLRSASLARGQLCQALPAGSVSGKVSVQIHIATVPFYERKDYPMPDKGRDEGFGGVVTPEAVVLQFERAGLGSRLMAAALDYAITNTAGLVLGVGIGYLVVRTSGFPTWIPVVLLIFLVFLVTFGYPVLFEAFNNGRTPGKAALGLRVVTLEGAPIRFRHAAVRGATGLLEKTATLGVIASISILVTSRHQRLGDIAAGTMLLRERSAVKMPVAMSFRPPAGAEQYASSLDVSHVTNDEYTILRSYIVRAGSFGSEGRSDLSRRIAKDLAQKLRATPPPNMSADVFLLCVASAYQRRFQPVSASDTGRQ